MLILLFNGVVITVIYTNKNLHEPMYILIAALLLNSVFGATALYPRLISDLLSEYQVISYQACMLQAFCIYTYAASEFTLLSAMAYDRYVSICKPLQYVSLVNILDANIPHIAAMIISVENMVFPPLINPIIYGLCSLELKVAFFKFFQSKIMHLQ
ncbi:olfactory receptor 4E1-like [Brachyhypopomus gauderio]|uniref:olfactory receptor 4E1-like n=1 Tax=Brachyhypopomus gauderio TaxID=698409 RepID=UPI0040412718